MYEVNLSYAKLRNAKLNGATLYSINLQGADLRDADLRGANLHKSDLRRANLQGAIIDEARISTENNFCGAIMPNGTSGTAYMMHFYRLGFAKIDCFKEK